MKKKENSGLTWSRSRTTTEYGGFLPWLCRSTAGLLFLIPILLTLTEGAHAQTMTAVLFGTAVFLLISACPKGMIRTGVSAAAAAVLLAVVLLYQGTARGGFAELANGWLSRFGAANGRIILPLDPVCDPTVAILLLSAALGMICAWGIQESAWILAVPFVGMVIGAAFSCVASGWLPFALLAGLILWITQKGAMWQRAIPLCLCAMLLVGLTLPAQTMLQSTGERIGGSVSRLVHRIRFENGSTSMPEGNLRNLAPLEPRGTAALEITMDNPHKLYLRGFVGEAYTGSAWETIHEEEPDGSAELFYWLHKGGFYAQSQIASAMETEETESVQVRNTGACREYAYLPYGLAGSALADLLAFPDAGVKGTAEYTVPVAEGGLSEWYNTQIDLLSGDGNEEYLALETAYRAYVYSHYITIPETTAQTLGQMLQEESGSLTLPEIQNRVRAFVSENLTYDTSVRTDSGDMDFVSYVLMGQKKGYSVHYATAAVCLLRYYGVPARYAEGYFLPAADAEKMEAGQTFSLEERYAHAWPEIYLDGVGWIPFEVTPGYIDDEDLEIQNLMEDPDSEIHQAVQHSYPQQHYEIPQAPVQQPEEQQEAPNPGGDFPWIQVVLFLMLIPAVLIVLCVARNLRLHARLRELEQGSPKQSIPMLLAYADRLLTAVQYDLSSGQLPVEEVEADSREALFSLHPMCAESRDRAAALCAEADRYCRKNCSALTVLKLRFLKGIMR